ncbi:MAG: hypothetical protein KGZ45_00025 [Clostridium sp.]|nr:hypothetical protein [Clostridium sp.]
MANRRLKIIVLFLAVSVVVFAFIPPEEQLGGWIRLIILHGILSFTGLYTIYAAGILGAIYLLTNKKSAGLWSRELGYHAVLLWFVGTALSLVSMRVAWGGMMWNEPYSVAALTMALLGIGKEYLARSSGGKLRGFAFANLFFAAAMLAIRQAVVPVMHPVNPIGSSDSAAIRLLPLLFFIITLATLIELIRLRLQQSGKQCGN